MTPQRLAQIERVFRRARHAAGEARRELLDAACGDDGDLREEVESLLREHDGDSEGFLESPPMEALRGLHAGAGTPAGGPLPARVGGYRILGRHGEGGMGVVYLAEQERTGRTVALKVIKSIQSPQMLRRFEQEARLLGRLRHPGIAQVYEAGIHEEAGGRVPFIAMERIDGPALGDYLRRRDPPVRERLELFALICDAVQHAHQHGVIHRDLKPGNILIDAAGDTGDAAGSSPQPKILDFGIARATDADVRTATLQTDIGQLLGTVPYMSPEQAAGDPEQLDTRSDVYALGVLLYEMLTGRLPYDVDNKLIHEAVRVIQESPPTPLGTIDRGLRGDLNTIVGKALAKDKSQRYQSAHDLAADVRRYLQDEPIAARPPSAAYQLRMLARRHRAVVVGGACVVAALVVGMIGTTWQAISATRERERAERRLNDVRHLARVFIFDFYEQVRTLPGSTPARQLLVETGLKYVNSLAEDLDPNDVELKKELGVAYVKLGDVQGDPTGPNLGDRDGALGNYRKGLALLQAAADGVSDDAEPLRDVARTHNRIGLLLRELNRPEEADGHFDIASRTLEALDRRFPGHAGVKSDLIFSHQIAGDRHVQGAEFEQALATQRRILTISEELLAAQPGNGSHRHNVASSHNQIANLLRRLDRPAEALESDRASVAALEALVRDEPHDVRYQRDLGSALERLGFQLQQSGDGDGAMQCFRRYLELCRKLQDADPYLAEARGGVIKALVRIGDLLIARGEIDGAAECFAESLPLAEAQAEEDPDNGAALRERGVAYYKMAEIEMHRGGDESLDSEMRAQAWSAARDWLRRCHAEFVQMRERGLLSADDAGVPDAVAAEMAQCEAHIGGTPAERPRDGG